MWVSVTPVAAPATSWERDVHVAKSCCLLGDFRRPKMGNVGIISHLHPKILLEPSGSCFWPVLYPERIRGEFPFQGFFLLFEAPCKISKPSASQPCRAFPGMLSRTFPAAPGNKTKPAEDYRVHLAQVSPLVLSKSGENWQEKLTHGTSWNALRHWTLHGTREICDSGSHQEPQRRI